MSPTSPPALFEEPGRPKKPPSQLDLDAWELLDALKPLISPSLKAMTPGAWRTRNAATARDMVSAGVTPEALIAAWETESARFGSPIVKLSQLQDALNHATFRGNGRASGRDVHNPTDDIPDILDLPGFQESAAR